MPGTQFNLSKGNALKFIILIQPLFLGSHEIFCYYSKTDRRELRDVG